MKKLSTLFVLVLLVMVSLNGLTQNLIVGGDMEESASDSWTISYLSNEEANTSEYAFGSTDEIPAWGTEGNLQFSVTNTNAGGAHLMFYQEVTLQGGKSYVADMAVLAVQEMNSSWFEVYLGTEPVEGADYGEGQMAFGGFKWSDWTEGMCSDLFDASLFKDGCIEGSGDTITIDGEGDVVLYFGFKAGIWGVEHTVEFAVDNVSLTEVAGVVSVNSNSALNTNVYPNPANDVLNISSNNEISKVAIFNMIGQELLNASSSNNINISDLSEGFYLVSITDINGVSTTQKFQKK